MPDWKARRNREVLKLWETAKFYNYLKRSQRSFLEYLDCVCIHSFIHSFVHGGIDQAVPQSAATQVRVRREQPLAGHVSKIGSSSRFPLQSRMKAPPSAVVNYKYWLHSKSRGVNRITTPPRLTRSSSRLKIWMLYIEFIRGIYSTIEPELMVNI